MSDLMLILALATGLAAILALGINELHAWRGVPRRYGFMVSKAAGSTLGEDGKWS